MRFCLIIFFLLLSHFGFNQNLLFSFQQNELYGFKDKTGKIVISPKYEMIFSDTFINPILAVILNGEWIYIDKTGKTLLKPMIFENGPDYFINGISRYVENENYGYFNETGVKITQASYDFCYPFENGIGVVCNQCTKITDDEHYTMDCQICGAVNSEGLLQIPIEFQQIYVNEFQQIVCKNSDFLYLYNLNGKLISKNKN